MPRRALAAIAATVTGLALLFSFKTPARAAHASTATVPAGTLPVGTEPGGTVPGLTVPATTPATTGTGATGTYRDGTQAGSVVGTEFGDVQVQVTTKGGKIVDVSALATPFDRRRSEEINSYATPILHDEVLAAQSAQIDTVSGATITSGAYAQSLQAALDGLRS